MRRKDVLIISAILIVITFLAVFGIYWAINGESIWGNVKEQVTEIVGNKKTHHSNGWETAIVDKIVHDVPVPVGFTYVEGNKKTGIVIEDSKTQEKYMWIPYQEVDEDIYNAVLANMNLDGTKEESRENIQKYGGFYVALGEELTEEISQEEYESLKLLNKSSKTAIETHAITMEEAMLINQMVRNIGIEINVSKLRAMTLSAGEEEIIIPARDENMKPPEIDIPANWNGWDENLISGVTGNKVPIPNGFEYEEKNGITKIKNTENLSFIWIPVEDVTEVRTKFLEAMRGEIEADQISIYETYADSLNSDEYKALEASIDKYGGFYISEAELGYDENGIVINKYRPMYSTKDTDELDYVTNGDYFRNVTNLADENTTLGKMQRAFNDDERNLYEKALDKSKELYADSEIVVSHLTYGLEYDATILYLLETKALTEEQAFKNSQDIGKYAEYVDEEDGNVKKSLWGKEEYLNEIYGLAGNLAEITQERDGDKVIIRGGSWDIPGNIEYIASKSPRGKTEIDVNNEGKIRSAVGFRACLYIKTGYEKNGDLDTKKKLAKDELKDYIAKTSIKFEGGEKNYFLNEKNEEGLYKNSALNDIVKYINERIDKETSSTGLSKIVQYGKEQIDIIRENIEEMLKYKEGYTYGETSAECFAIKEQAISDMQNVHWKLKGEKVIITDWAGTETSYLEIRTKAETDIEKARNTYKEKIYTEEIENYIATHHSDIANEEWIQKIKTEAKSELMNTQDLVNIMEIAAKYQEKIENGKKEAQKTPTPTTPEPTTPTNEEGYISTMTVKAGDKCEKRTAKDGTEVSAIGSFKGNWDIYIYENGKWTRKEDGDATQLCWIDQEGTINTNKAKKGTARAYVTNENGDGVDLSQGYYVIKVVEKEAQKTPTPTTQPATKTQYQLDVEQAQKNGWQIYKSSESIDESKLGTGTTQENTYTKKEGYSWYYHTDNKPTDCVVVALNEYITRFEKKSNGFVYQYFDTVGIVKFRAYWPNGFYRTYTVTVEKENPVILKLKKKGYKPMSDTVRTNCYYTGDNGYIYLDVGGKLFVQCFKDDYKFISCKPEQNAYDHEAVKRSEGYMPGISRLPTQEEMSMLGYIRDWEGGYYAIQFGNNLSEWINERYDNGAHCYIYDKTDKDHYQITTHSWWGTHEYRICLDFTNF